MLKQSFLVFAALGVLSGAAIAADAVATFRRRLLSATLRLPFPGMVFTPVFPVAMAGTV